MTHQELILKYPKIFDVSNQSRISWEFPKGWFDLVDQLCQEIQSYCDEHPEYEQVKCDQIKEKFGGLRFYINSGTDEVYEIIGKYAKKSTKLCNECSCTDCEIVRTKGWILYLCKPCAIKLNKNVE